MTYNCKQGYYTYDPAHPHAVKEVRRTDGTLMDSYEYDLNGNMTSGAGRTITYDDDNRPISITYGSTTSFVYDAGGKRVKKITPSLTTIYIGDIYECANSNCAKYIFAGSNRIAKLENTERYFYHTDHLGSASVMTDSNANIAQELYYYPYGEIKTNTCSDGSIISLKLNKPFGYFLTSLLTCC